MSPIVSYTANAAAANDQPLARDNKPTALRRKAMEQSSRHESNSAQMIPMIVGNLGSATTPKATRPALHLIAVCDVLGFSDMIGTQALQPVYEKYLQLRGQVRAFQGIAGFTPGAERPLLVLDGVVFSDTILLWAPAGGAMEVLAMSLCVLVAQALLFGLPLRVGVAFGECVIDSANDIYIGQPIIDAYRTENRQQWMGGAYHHSCWGLPGFRERLCHLSTAVRYPVPVKSGEGSDALDYALNWTLLAGGKVPVILSEQELRAAGSDKIKWQNTRAFYDAVRVS